MLVNVFRGIRTGKLQVEPLSKGLTPKVKIFGEASLVWLRSEER